MIMPEMMSMAAASRDAAEVSGTGPTLATSVAERIRRAIIRGELAPGAKVNIDRFRESFGVSLSPLREALSRLASEGFLTFQDKRGYRIAAVSERDLRQIITLRSDLESLALRQAIALGDGEWESAVRGKLADLRSIKRDNDVTASIDAWEQAHQDFHFELLAGCEMPLLMQFTNTLHDLNDRYRRLFLATRPRTRDTATEHLDIVSAALDRRTREAVGLLRSHIERTGSEILKVLPRMVRDRPF